MPLHVVPDPDVSAYQSLVRFTLARQYKNLKVLLEDCEFLQLSDLKASMQQVLGQIDELIENTPEDGELTCALTSNVRNLR